MVTIRNQATRTTTMLPHRERLADFCGTDARLTCTTRVNFHEHASGTFSLVREHKEKVRPSGIVNTLSKHPTCQTFDIEIFDCNQPVLIHDLSRFFVMKVPALIADVIVESREQQDRFTSAVRSFLTTRNASLQSAEFRLCRTKPTRVINLSSVAQSSERSQANVNADHVRIERQRRRLNFDGEQCKPTTGLVLDGEAFDRTFKLSMQLDTHVANLRQSQTFSDQPMSGSAICDAVILARRAKARISGLLSSLYPCKECGERQVNTFQRLFQNVRVNSRHVIADLLNLRELQILIEPRDRFPLALPSVAAFLQGSVVQLAANGKLFVQRLLLSLCWIDAVAIGLDQGAPILADRFSDLNFEVAA